MKIIFFGSSDFSIPILKSLLASKHSIVKVITTPDRKKGRGQKLGPSAVKDFAISRNLIVISPEKLSHPSVIEEIKRSIPDLMVIASYGKMVPTSVFTLSKVASLNVHPSLLPCHRGASPIQSAILEGDEKTGVSIAEVTDQLDAGDLYGQAEIQIGDHENAQELSQRLAEIGSKLLLQVIEKLESGKVTKTKQDESKMTYAKKLDRDSGHIHWQAPATSIDRLVRAFYPWPSAFTFFQDKRLKVLRAQVADRFSNQGRPGLIIGINKSGAIQVQTQEGVLELIQVQLEGRREMSGFDFALGQRIKPGDSFQ